MTKNEREYERLDRMADLLDAMGDVIADMKVDCMTEIQRERKDKRSPEVQRFFDRIEYAVLYPTKKGE